MQQKCNEKIKVIDFTKILKVFFSHEIAALPKQEPPSSAWYFTALSGNRVHGTRTGLRQVAVR